MLNVSSSTTVSDERGPTPICSTVAWPSPTTRSAEVVIVAKVSHRRGKNVPTEHGLRTDVALQGLDGLRELGAGVVRAPQVVQQFGAAGDVGRVVRQRLQLV